MYLLRMYMGSPVDVDVSGLADSVATVLCLGIHGGVPVAVVEYYCVGPSQVHAYTSAASWQNEAENTPICIEALHEGLKEKKIHKEQTLETADRLLPKLISFPPIFCKYFSFLFGICETTQHISKLQESVQNKIKI